MDEDLGKHDAGWDGGFSSRTEWVVGLDESGLCQQLAQAKADADSSELVKAVVAECKTSEGRPSVQEALRKRFAGAKPGDAVQRSLDNLREVSAILAANPPGDAPAFKVWLTKTE
jgi:hypothetical protein